MRFARLFAKAYWHRFQVELPELHPVLVNLHTAVVGRRKPLPLEAINPSHTSDRQSSSEQRPVWFDGQWLETPVFQRDQIPRNHEFSGPAIIEQFDTTIVIEPADHARIDPCGNVIIAIGGAA